MEAHVRVCPRCDALLADSERIRAILLADDPGPIPEAVATRIQAAITAECDAPTVPATVRSLPVFPAAAPPASQAAPRPRPGMAPRRRTGSQRTRRQVREEERDARPSHLGRWLAVAAGVAVLAVSGVALSQWHPTFTGGASTTAGGASSGSTAAAAPGQPAVPVLATGTDYTSANLVAQARTLIAEAPSAFASERGVKAPAPATPGAAGSDEAQAHAPSPLAAGDASGQSLRNPQALAACLQAINAAGLRPVAVDLATYQGRPAAILVLPGRNGGYEVWAVARDCRPGADGTLRFITMR